MRLRKTASKNVNPVAAAVAIALTLGAVQYFWWTRLVMKPPGRPGGGPMGGGGPGPRIPMAFGLKDVKVDTLAGAPEPGYADGPGSTARFDGPAGLAVGPDGSVVVADTRNNCIRLVSPIGHTSTLAGGPAGFRDGAAAQALFDGPSGVAVGPDGAVYVADTNNHRIRRIQNGTVLTVAGGPAGVVDGPAATARFNLPAAVAIDSSIPGGGALLVADSGNHRVRRIRLSPASVETVTSEPTPPTSVASSGGQAATACPETGSLAIAARRISKLPIDLGEDAGSFPKDALTVGHPASVCASGREWLVTDAVHAAVIRVRPSDAQVIAGFAVGSGPLNGYRDGTGDRAEFGVLSGIAADGHGHVFVSDGSNNVIRRITLPPEGLP